MTPQQNTTPAPPPQLGGSSTTTAGISALIIGGLGIFAQILGVSKGSAIDPTQLAGSIGVLATGIGLVKAADASQAPKKAKKK